MLRVPTVRIPRPPRRASQAKGWEHFKKRLGKKSGSRGAATEAGAKDKKGAGGGGGGEGGPKPPPIRDLLTQLGLALFALAMVELASSASQESKAKEINWQVFYSGERGAAGRCVFAGWR